MRLATNSRLFLAVVCVLFRGEILAADPKDEDAWRAKASPGEIELVETVQTLHGEFDKLYTAQEKIEDPVEKREFYRKHDPAREFIPKLLEFEEKHRGTRLGLLACRKVIILAGSGGELDNPLDVGRRQVVEQLPNYVEHPLFPEVIRFLGTGNFEPSVVETIKKLVSKKNAGPLIRDLCRLKLARCYLDEAAGRDFLERRIQELDAGEKPRYSFEREHRSKSLVNYSDWNTIREREAEAVSLLKQLASENADHHLPAVKDIGPGKVLIELDVEPNTNRSLAEIAKGLLFKELHLKNGKLAPNLRLKLLTGRDWSLKAQWGRVVIIQFSFKGCGPCEAMYPDLRELAAAHPDELTVLSIMADEEKQDSIKAMKSGKISWDVSWDGHRGPTCTRWDVQSYPTVYIIDKQGVVADSNLRGEQLKKKIAELISAPKQSPDTSK